MKRRQILRLVAISTLAISLSVFVWILPQFGFGTMIFYFLAVIPGTAITIPVTLLTGWNCSLWWGGHAPSCELGLTLFLYLVGSFWAIFYLVRNCFTNPSD